jgi:hypothetical protein
VIRPRGAGRVVLLVCATLLPFLPEAARAQMGDGCRMAIDYGDSVVGEFPAGWQARDDAARATYRVVAEGAIRFVRATETPGLSSRVR